jgi:carbamoyl-phosphate synthase large subunit
VPKRTDIKKIMILGAGPIVIGQACEFDYSGTQGCKALKQEGYEIILVNSNPATIMTDPEIADRTYVEPITPEIVAKILEKERPDAILPTLGGQTALNTAVALAKNGTLDRLGIELIGAKLHAIEKAEDRSLFKQAMLDIGLDVPRSGLAHNDQEAMEVIKFVGFPAILRPAFTMGGHGGGIAYNMEEYVDMARTGIDASPVREILVEESIIGWKEFELEVMRDRLDNVVMICSIENLDPMGVHTGDSITVAPAQTLTDKEYQMMRDAAQRIIREIGVDTGGCNIQFGVDPKTGRLVIIEMNPRVSRSSALASKATGYPIAKIAAKLAVGYTLDEIPNDITKNTPASFEPTIDYVVTKVPRFTFEKFPQAQDILTTQMKSVGEAMAIGRTFKESLQKALRSMEIDRYGFESPLGLAPDAAKTLSPEDVQQRRSEIMEPLRTPNSKRLWYVGDAIRLGMTMDEIFQATFIDPWFLANIYQIITLEGELAEKLGGGKLNEDSPGARALLTKAKRWGFSDRRIAQLVGVTEHDVRARRKTMGLRPVFKRVDTCGAEFVANTPYLYSAYEEEDDSEPTDRKKIMILGGGPNRIGQGIEFDYCCVHSVYALKEEGFETIMVNCNPETVSTDYDTSDRLFFEPLTLEDVLHIVESEKPKGVIVQFGGQTPLKLAVPLEKAGVKILGTSPDAIDRAEDRERFAVLLRKLGLRQPENGIARSEEEAITVARQIGYPVMVRPSYVLGGRAMEIVNSDANLRDYMKRAVQVSPEHPVLIDSYLVDAIEVDVDAICDGDDVFVGGIMQHIEEAGIHSGDSACSLPPYSLPQTVIAEIRKQTEALARELEVVGLMNIQFAVKDQTVYILEVNPRASRTVPFVSKATGVPLAKIAAKVMAGRKLRDLGYVGEMPELPHMAVKEAVFPFMKFLGVDTILGPEMKSTGEVMGIDKDFGRAFAKAQLAAGTTIPSGGTVFISVRERDKAAVTPVAKRLVDLGFQVVATDGTHKHLEGQGIPSTKVFKVTEGGRPHIVDRIKNREIDLIINTTEGPQAVADSFSIRRTALTYAVPVFTTIAAAHAVADAIAALKTEALDVAPLQEYHKLVKLNLAK